MAKSQPIKFSDYPPYTGNDLGMNYTAARSSFRVWAPTADSVQVCLYRNGLGGDPLQAVYMQKSGGGTWVAGLQGDQAGVFYAYRVRINGSWSHEVADPYARAVGVNGRRAMVADMRATDPEGWSADKSPAFGNGTDAVIYELHVRDASISRNSGIRQKGKFVGLTEKGTRNSAGMSTGLDHIRELGVTHVHLLPSFDFYSVDETQSAKPQYNWGYDPLNYNVPEGSYATNAEDGTTRIREFKSMVQSFHNAGLRVVMDVVYNHTMLTADSWFNQLVPGYYYRQKDDGSFSNATACGNETASERPMMRKFMLESVKYWVQEYHVDGFRFDLMGVHDIETMNLIAKELRAIKPDILLYGEGWTAGACPLPDDQRALKKNASKLDHIAVFSDDIRDGIKGSVFDNKDGGFASGKPGMQETIKFGIVAATNHPQVKFSAVNYSNAPYAAAPDEVITYCECHDNHVLWDKLKISSPDATEMERTEMHKLSLTIVLSSQGIPFLHAGTEFLRTKKGVENSFESGDSINAIDWDLKTRNSGVFDYVKGLVAMRKEHPAFRMTSAERIATTLKFTDATDHFVAYTIDGKTIGDPWKKIYVAFNGAGTEQLLHLPAGKWKTHVANNRVVGKGKPPLSIAPYSAVILYQL